MLVISGKNAVPSMFVARDGIRQNVVLNVDTTGNWSVPLFASGTSFLGSGTHTYTFGNEKLSSSVLIFTMPPNLILSQGTLYRNMKNGNYIFLKNGANTVTNISCIARPQDILGKIQSLTVTDRVKWSSADRNEALTAITNYVGMVNGNLK